MSPRQKRRAAGDPWYTAIYQEPHSMWWAPAVVLFAVILVLDLFVLDKGLRDALISATILATAYAALGYVSLRRSRR